MVFVALWFGSATMVALVFTGVETRRTTSDAVRRDGARLDLWRRTMRMAALSVLPFTLVPLLELRGVGNDPAVWLLDAALVISLCTVPYFTLVARTVIGGFALSVGAFQALWIGGASVCFVIMERSVRAQGGRIGPGAAFEEFFRRPEYRYLFYILVAIMLVGYCPALFWFGRRRFLRHASHPRRTGSEGDGAEGA